MRSVVVGDGYTLYEDGRVVNKSGLKLSPSDNGKGYLIVSLYFDGVRKTKAIHRLLGEYFIPNPDNLSDVDHIDGDRQNNSLSNLRWLTHGDNIEHSFNLKNRSATGVNNARCVTTEEEVHEICKLLQEGLSSVEIRDKGHKYALVRAIKTRRNWSTISCSYVW